MTEEQNTTARQSQVVGDEWRDRWRDKWHPQYASLAHAISAAAQDMIVSSGLVRNKTVEKRLAEHADFLGYIAYDLANGAPTSKLAKARELLQKNFSSFCDADVFPGSDTFADAMEAAGFIELVPVTKEALEDSFAAERGIEPGGMMYRLTDAGRAALSSEGPAE